MFSCLYKNIQLYLFDKKKRITHFHSKLLSILQAHTSLNFSICPLTKHLICQFVQIYVRESRTLTLLLLVVKQWRRHCQITSLPLKVPVKLSVALVRFFFLLLEKSGMFTGWLFSISAAEQKNYTCRLRINICQNVLPFKGACIQLLQPLQVVHTCCTLREGLRFFCDVPIVLDSRTGLSYLAHSQGVAL